MKDYEVGEEFQFGRIKLRVKESNTSCVGCVFQKMSWNTCHTFHEFIGACGCNNREDKKSIIFVKVEDKIMPCNRERVEELLIHVLNTLAEATVDIDVEETDCGTIYSPVLKYAPNFEFTKDDISLIKKLGKDNMEDFSTLTEC